MSATKNAAELDAAAAQLAANAPTAAANDPSQDSLDHIDPRLHKLMFAPLAARIRHVLSDLMIMHPNLVGVCNEVEWLIREPVRQRARGLMIIADWGNGKSAIASHVQGRYPCNAPPGNPKQVRTVTISMSGARKTKDVLNRIHENAGSPISRRFSTSDHQSLVIETLRRANCRLLVLDECQDVAQIAEREQQRVLESLKYMMNTLRLPILALGTEPARQAFKVDPHLQARFDFIDLPRWQVGEDFTAFLDAYEQCLPLKRPSNLSATKMQEALIKISGGILDKILTRIRLVAVNAMVDGTECVTVEAVLNGCARPLVDILGPR